MAELPEGRKLPSTIRVLSDVCDSIVILGRLDEYLRNTLQASSENDPTEMQAKNIVTMLGTVIEKLADIQGDLTMGVKK